MRHAIVAAALLTAPSVWCATAAGTNVLQGCMFQLRPRPAVAGHAVVYATASWQRHAPLRCNAANEESEEARELRRRDERAKQAEGEGGSDMVDLNMDMLKARKTESTISS